MTKLHLNYDGKQNNGIIFNDKYLNGALYSGAEFKPELSFLYSSFQYSEVFDSLNYIEIDGVKTVMTPEQEQEIITIATAWIQPLGQEGNPNEEQRLKMIENDIQSHIDRQANALGYDGIASIGKYLGYDNPFRAECEKLGLFNANCWVAAFGLLQSYKDGTATFSTSDEIIALLPKFE